MPRAGFASLIGRPNAGKSSLVNRLLGEERHLVAPEAGTTRDAIDSVLRFEGRTLNFIDTAGLRKRSKVEDDVEFYATLRTERAVERADVCVLVVDATLGMHAQDLRIASDAWERGRGLIIVVNKWDLVEEKDETYRGLREQLAPFDGADVVRTSAIRGGGIRRLPAALLQVHERWASRAPTSKVNEVIRLAQQERPAPRGVGTFRYATQVSSGPPSFVLFGGAVPDPSYRRYLENRLRSRFELSGVPIRLSFRPKQRR